MKEINNTIIRMNSTLSLFIANNRNEKRIFIIDSKKYVWSSKNAGFFVDGIYKTAANVYTYLSCDLCGKQVQYIEILES